MKREPTFIELTGLACMVIVLVAIFASFIRPAHAGVTDDAAAVRRSLEHIEHILVSVCNNDPRACSP
jgi:hypothetical protein